MTIREVSHGGPPLGEVDIEGVEREMGVRLPDDYRSFLLRFNGGQPTPDAFLFRGGSDGSLVNIFFGVNHPDPRHDLVRVWRDNRRVLPPDLLPIGYDAGGSLLLVGVSGERRGRVYFEFHELAGEDDDPMNEESMGDIADSFTDFIATFYEA